MILPSSVIDLLLVMIAIVSVCILCTIVIIRSNRLRDLEITVEALKATLIQTEIANVNIVKSLVCLEEAVSMQRAAFEEIAGSHGEQMDKAGDLFYVTRMKIMKLIHHSGLATSDDQSAVRSSWALATEFGEQDSLELMSNLERFRRPESLATFQQHRSILSRRLNADSSN